MRYMVVIERGEASWGAQVPDLPGCIAVGNTRDDVLRPIGEAIELHIRALEKDGVPVPPPSSEGDFVEVGAAQQASAEDGPQPPLSAKPMDALQEEPGGGSGDDTRRRHGSLGIGLGAGVGAGFGLGLLFDSLLAGILVGIAIGVAIGVALKHLFVPPTSG